MVRTAEESVKLARALEVADRLPPLSPLVRHLLSAVSGPGEPPPLALLAAWIESDMLAAGKVLGLANSAFYSRGAPILSVRQAVARLGLNAIRDLVLAMSVGALWRGIPVPQQWSVARFVEHSMATALLSEVIASAVAPEETEYAFLAGLFHDIGRLILAVLLRDDSAAIERLRTVGRTALARAELDLAAVSHAEISAAVVRSWNLPRSIEIAIQFHENPSEDPSSGGSGTVVLSEIVHAADSYVDSRGWSLMPDADVGTEPEEPLDGSGLKIDDVLFNRFNGELEALLGVL